MPASNNLDHAQRRLNSKRQQCDRPGEEPRSGADRIRIFGLGAPGSTALCRIVANEISTCVPAPVKADESLFPLIRAQQQIERQSGQIEVLKALYLSV